MISGYASDGQPDGDVGVVTDLTNTPWGGSHAGRVTYFDRSVIPCSEGHGPEVGVRINFPNADQDQPREIWWEAYARFDANWHTHFCGGFFPSPEHKFIMHYERGNQFRWNMMEGSQPPLWIRYFIDDWDFSGAVDIAAAIPPGDRNNELSSLPLWDGQWHQYRGHYRMGNGDGRIEAWIDGVKVFDNGGLTSEGPPDSYFAHVYLGSNHNHRPDREMTLLFGCYRVFIGDPGW